MKLKQGKVIPASGKRLDFYPRENSGLFGQALLRIAQEASSQSTVGIAHCGKALPD